MADTELAEAELWRRRSWRRRSCGGGGAGGGGAVAEAELAEAAEAALAAIQRRWRPGWRRWSWRDEALARRKPRGGAPSRNFGKGATDSPNSWENEFPKFHCVFNISLPELGWYARKSDNPSQAFR